MAASGPFPAAWRFTLEIHMMKKMNAALTLKAAHFASEKHKNQRRKDVEASPYINHPLALASVLVNP